VKFGWVRKHGFVEHHRQQNSAIKFLGKSPWRLIGSGVTF